MKKRILGILLCLIMAVGMLPTMAMAQENAPAFNLERDLEGITIPENLVIVTCETTEQSKNYGAISGGFDTDKAKPYLGDDGVWKVVVQLKLDVYKNQYDAETGTTHTVSGIGNTMISFTLEYVNKMWKVKGNFPSVPISVRCNNNHENQTPNLPMYPTIDNISGLNDKIVAVLCANTQAGQSSGKYYGLLNGGFTSTMPTREGDMYESTLTLIPSVYCNQYSTDTGIQHTVNPKQNAEDLTFVVKYDEAKKLWMPKEDDVKPMGIWVNCDKHEAQPQPPEMPMYPTIDNISGLNNKIVAVLCANTQAGQSSGKYYGLLNGGFTSTMPTREGDMYESTLTLIPSVYCNQYSTDTGIQHTVNPKQNAEDLTFVVKYDEAKKLWMPKEDDVKPMGIWVNCDKHEAQPQPPEMPMYPTIDNISGLNNKIVAVLCANTQAGQSSGKYYGLLNGGFTSTMPTREGDMYESTLTLIPSVYCNQYSTDTGIQHTVNPKQNAEDLTFVVKYDEAKKLWMPKEDDVKPMGIWVNCDKHETSTSVTPVYPPSGGGSTIKPGSNGSNQGDGAVVNPDNNQGDNKDKVDTGNKQTGKTKKSDTMEKVPKTGDNTAMTIWLVLLLFSVGALFGTVAFDRKRKRI